MDKNSYTDRNYDYNPVTDKYYKVSDSKPLSVDEKAYQDNMERKAKEHAESLRRQQENRDLNTFFAVESAKVEREIDRKLELEKELQKEAYINEMKVKREAAKKAYERYKSKSIFYRMFHKSVYNMKNYKQMNVDEINELYGGKSR